MAKLSSSLNQDKRGKAYEKFKIIESYINGQKTLKLIASQTNLPLRTLTSWVKKYKNKGMEGLIRQPRKDKGVPRKYDSKLIDIVEGVALHQPELSKINVHKLISEYCIQNSLSIPSYKTICKIIGSIPKDLIVLNNEGTKAYQQKYDLLNIRSSKKPNEIWQADHLLVDLEILNENNKLKKPWLTIILDDCSRAISGYELSFLSPSSLKTSLCLRQAIWRKADPNWPILGLPTIFYTDHGSDFTSKHIEQVCADLKIQLIHSQVGQPRGRGKIERFFRTLNQKLFSNIKATSSSKNKFLNLKQLDELIYQFIINYNNAVHSELKMSPIDRWQKDGFLPQMLDSLEKLDLLLMTEAKTRKILREGIHFQGLKYVDPILAEYIGESVIVRYTPSDITSIRVFHNDKFLCQPLCHNLSQEKIGIKEIQQARNKRRREIRKQIKKRKSLVEAIIDANNQSMNFQTKNEENLVKPQKKSSKIKLYYNE